MTRRLVLIALLLVAAWTPSIPAQTPVPVRLQLQLGHSLAVSSVAFSPDRRFVLTGSWDGTARLWDTATGNELRRFEGHSSNVHSVAFSPNGLFVLTGSWDRTARLWDTATGNELRRFAGHSYYVYSVAFSPDGLFVLTGSGDGTARLWDAATGDELRRFAGHSSHVRSVAFSPDGRSVLTGGRDQTARLWDAVTGNELRRLVGHAHIVHSVAFSPDGRFVLTASGDKTTRLWDTATGNEVRRFEGHSSYVYSAAFSPDGHYVLTGSDDRTARLWDIATDNEVRHFEGHSSYVVSVTFSPDGRYLLMGGGDRTAQLWDTVTGNEVRRFEGHSFFVRSVIFSPDGHFVLTGSEDESAHLWDTATGKEIRRFEGHSHIVTSVAFSPDGRWVLTGSGDRTARLWDAVTGKEIRRFGDSVYEMYSAVFSPDGRLVVSSGMMTQLWQTTTGSEVRRFVGHSLHGNSVAFSPDGRFVLTGSEDRTARLWDTATGSEVRRFEGHSGIVYSVAFSLDGRWVITGSSDGTARLWDAASGKELATMVSFSDGAWAVVDPDGRFDTHDPDNVTGLHFVAGNDVIALSQLKERFYAPGLLGRIWRGERLPEVAALREVNLVPGLEVQPPAADSREAVVRLTNRGGGIGKVTVKVNNRELPDATRGGAIETNAVSAEVRINLAGATLSPTGANVIEVFAENGDGILRTRGQTVAWHTDPPKALPEPRLFAIVVGVSRYGNSFMDLRYAAKDAIDFSHALELSAHGLFSKERTFIRLLASGTETEPTKENIREAFEAVARESQAQDLLVVYFAGHGAEARDERDAYYYFTREARSAEVERDIRLRAVTTVSSAELRDWLGRTNMPLKQVLILDTCAAGAAFGDMVKLAEQRNLSPDQIRAIDMLKDSAGSWILMGSAADAVSYEASRYGQGLLTYALLQGMKGAALDGDRVEVSRLFGYAQREVLDLARGIGGIQRPVLSAPKGQPFPIGMLDAESRRRIRLAAVKPQLLRVRVLDDNDLDTLKLEPVLRAALREESTPTARGEERTEPRLVYLDSVVDEVPDALIPQIRYGIQGNRTVARIRLLKDGERVAEETVQIEGTDAGSISERIRTVLLTLPALQ